MKGKPILLLGIILAIALSPGLALAQHAGLQIAVAQPQLAPPPVQPPAVAVRSTFTGQPVLVIPPPLPVFAAPVVPLVPAFPTVIVPNPAFPNPGVPGPNPVPFPGHRPQRGTPRADVIRAFGQPSVTIITSTGETLYFSGGVTVILQNGQVIGSK